MKTNASALRRLAPLSNRTQLWLFASIIVSLLAASSAPTPLYARYQLRWGFTAVTTTTVFGVYAVAVMVSLLILGRLSDFVGRRPVVGVALAGQASALVMFTVADGVPQLFGARVVQGLSTGAALAALGAGLVDLDRTRGALANSAAPGAGTALGALGSAFAAEYLPAPDHLVYLILLVVFAVQAVGLLLARETVHTQPYTRTALVPDIKLPTPLRGPILTAVPVLFAVWALAGLYGSLGPALISTLVGRPSIILGSLGLFVLAGASVTSILLCRNLAPRPVLLVGLGALIAGVAWVVAALSWGSPVQFFLGTAISGVGFGLGLQGSLRTVVPLAQPDERAGVLALLWIAAYLGLGVPAVIAGVRVARGHGLTETAQQYGVAVIALATIAALLALSAPKALDPPAPLARKPQPPIRLVRVTTTATARQEATMTEPPTIDQDIQALIAHEHSLRERLARGEISVDDEHAQLRAAERQLDRLWDLLRQRQARSEFGRDPDEASPRPESTVEGYLQ